MTATTIRLDLDRLVREYWKNLNVTLRGFIPAGDFDFLAAWVPSDDLTMCVLEVVELARDTGPASVVIVLESASFSSLDQDRLTAECGPFRSVMQGDQVELHFDWQETPSLDVHVCYRDAMSRVLENVTHEKNFLDTNGQARWTVQLEGVALSVLIDSQRQTVSQALFYGVHSTVERAILEAICRTMEGKPIQECADHALISVESQLRSRSQPQPVAGLVTPENADPAFRRPQQLIRNLLAEYRRQTGLNDTKNFYDRPVQKTWLRLNDTDRLEVVSRVLQNFDPHGRAEIVGMEGLKRVVIRFTQHLTNAEKQDLMRGLEVALRNQVEPTLHCMCEVRTDANYIRQPDKRSRNEGETPAVVDLQQSNNPPQTS